MSHLWLFGIIIWDFVISWCCQLHWMRHGQYLKLKMDMMIWNDMEMALMSEWKTPLSVPFWYRFQSTVRCRYNAVNFRTNIHETHPTAHPLGRGMVCLLWIQHLIDIRSQFLQLFMQKLTILDRIISALHCKLFTIYLNDNIDLGQH